MNLLYLFGGIYFCSVAIGLGATIISESIEIAKLKKENYEIFNKKKLFIENLKVSWFAFLPGFNVALPFIYKDEFNEMYFENREYYISDGIIIDKEQLKLQQENAIIKEHKFKAAREELMNNKINTFETLEDYQKIEIIKNERENIECGIENNELGNSYNNLTNKEKIEFLNLLRDEVLANHQFQTTKNNKIKRK